MSELPEQVPRLRSADEALHADAGHVPIMVRAIVDLFRPGEGETLVDLTLGRGGHALEIGRRLGATGQIVGFDVDPANLAFAGNRLRQHLACSITTHHCNYEQAPDVLHSRGVCANMVLADLGFSSTQMDDPQRGFSFQVDGPLDMRLDPALPLTAEEIVNHLSQGSLADIIFRLGEEPLARKIAAEIVAARAVEPIKTTARLAALVRSAYGRRARTSRMHPATKVFMALRIAVNDELGHLERLWNSIADAAGMRGIRRRQAIDRRQWRYSDRLGPAGLLPITGSGTEPTASSEASAAAAAESEYGEIEKGRSWLARDARIGFLTFHSLEDRIVKRSMMDLVHAGLARRLIRKVMVADEQEVSGNPRARSAKLRIIELCTDGGVG